MSLTVGTRLGPYEIVAPLGAGGMGEVYRARDSKLGRDVALKILPERVARDPERVARFEREARTLASLNHPHIAQIYGFQQSDDTAALVMELVDGEDLSQRIARGPVPQDEALPMALQICAALEAAHAQGIVHRDLKPGNIKVRPDGTVKVLDFGLAKALVPDVAGDGSPSSDTDSPTITSPAQSHVGIILGTAAYMAPEQARGKAVDRRADIWAFGCVLYEMLAGRRAFRGGDVAGTLAAIITQEPDWDALPATTPPAIRRLLRRTLQKDPNKRLRHIGDAAIEMEEALIGAPSEAGAPSAASRGWERAAWIAALTLVSAVGIALAVSRIGGPAPPPTMHVDINTPPTTDPASMAISHDGKTIAFVATDAGRARLWVRPLDAASARPLAGTDGAQFPFWAPDGRSIGFFADDGRLKRLDLDGGVVRELARAWLPRGGAWGADGTILYAPSTGPLFRVPAAGGEPTIVTSLAEQQTSHTFPAFLPDGRRFVFYVTGGPEVRGVYIADLDGQGMRRVVDADSMGVAASREFLFFVRGKALFAQRFDPRRPELTGSPIPVVDSIGGEQLFGFQMGPVSASGAGHIIYRSRPTSHERQFVWFDRKGAELRRLGHPDAGGVFSPEMSADGRRVAVHRTADGNVDIWFLDPDRGGLSRFTTHVANEIHPLWSPDSRRVVFTSNRSGNYEQYQKSTLGASEETLISSMRGRFTDWSRDGRWLLLQGGEAPRSQAEADIWALPADGDRKPFPVVQTESDDRDGQFSPDGKWIAYATAETGRWEVYVQPFPGPGLRTAVSIDGGAQPRWRSDGKELFFVALDGHLMAVPMSLPPDGGAPKAGTPAPLFMTHIGGAVQSPSKPQYVVSPDGSRFLMNTVLEDESVPPITLIVNWTPRPGM
jgi:Tol biopolymer transport system component/tRNA A-37 threonylcarbamoyl transferase component Bud32